MALSPSNVEYLDFNWPFYPGCEHWKNPEICPVGKDCWAKRFAENPHFGGKKGNFEPHLVPGKLLDPLKRKKPARIGVNFTGDLFGDWVKPNEFDTSVIMPSGQQITNCHLSSVVKHIMSYCPQHQFFFLTKRPKNIPMWGQFPDNAWVGATCWNVASMNNACHYLSMVEAKHRWLSIEPLISRIDLTWFQTGKIDWITIGGWSGGKNPPKIEWIKEIVDAADQAGIPVFLKDNLKPLAKSDITGQLWEHEDADLDLCRLRQEMPELKK